MERLNTNLFADELMYSRIQNMRFIESMIKMTDNKRKRIINKYNEIFNICMSNIKIAFSIGKEDLIYKIPFYVSGIPEYNTKDCLTFIKQRIMELYMDSSIISQNEIFITWHYIELNRINQIT